jgi:multiple sugar transport system ATP-binding protein
LALVSTTGITKKYGGVTALNDISIEAKSGEFVVLLGPSGSGKTTLLRCIAGLEIPDAGSVLIDGKIQDGIPARERDVSMVFQNYALFPLMTARENIAFPLKMRGAPAGDIESSVNGISEKLGIKEILDKRPRQLSGGEQQRVAIGRAIVRPTNALLMDEPLSNLDAPLRAQLRTELKSLQRELGMTVMYVTHDQVEAMTLADKIGVLNKGRLVQFDAPGRLYDNPLTSFVAGFVGSPAANKLRVEIVSKTAFPTMLIEGASVEMTPELAARLRGQDGRTLTMTIRPEDVHVSTESAKGAIPTIVRLIEPLGASIILDLALGDKMVKALVSPDFEARLGSTLWLAIDFGSAHFYSSESDELVS